VTGHRIKGQYNFAKNLAGGLTYIYSQRTPDRSLDQDQQFNTLMLDLMVKF
jgi:opacity protein-like surface antigen